MRMLSQLFTVVLYLVPLIVVADLGQHLLNIEIYTLVWIIIIHLLEWQKARHSGLRTKKMVLISQGINVVTMIIKMMIATILVQLVLTSDVEYLMVTKWFIATLIICVTTELCWRNAREWITARATPLEEN